VCEKHTEEKLLMRNRLAVPVLAVTLATSGFVFAQPLPSPASAFQQSGWDTPPAEFREIQRQGFHDGIEGARKDFDNKRKPDVNSRDEYRHPRVAPSVQADYREAFRRGYETAMDHLMHANAEPQDKAPKVNRSN
jgi:hypothetical protein